MPIRENCRHFESREYDDGEVARFCTLDLAPEAPWRCPANCPKFELSANDGSFETGSLESTVVEAEPDDDPGEIVGVLADAEQIVNAAEADVLADLDRRPGTTTGLEVLEEAPAVGRRRLPSQPALRAAHTWWTISWESGTACVDPRRS